MSIEMNENSSRQALLSIAQKICRNMVSSYLRSVYEINGVKYDMLCKKRSDGSYYAEVYHVRDIKADEYTICDVSWGNILYRFDYDELKE